MTFIGSFQGHESEESPISRKPSLVAYGRLFTETFTISGLVKNATFTLDLQEVKAMRIYYNTWGGALVTPSAVRPAKI